MAVVQDLTVGGGSKHLSVTAAQAVAGITLPAMNRLCQILVTTANGANPITITDGAGQDIIAIVPASAAIGTLIKCQAPILNSAIVVATAAAGAFTVFYN